MSCWENLGQNNSFIFCIASLPHQHRPLSLRL